MSLPLEADLSKGEMSLGRGVRKSLVEWFLALELSPETVPRAVGGRGRVEASSERVEGGPANQSANESAVLNRGRCIPR